VYALFHDASNLLQMYYIYSYFFSKQFLAVLSVYATGSYQSPTGMIFDFPIAQPTLSQYVKEVTNALNEDEVLARMIRFPSNDHEMNNCIDR